MFRCPVCAQLLYPRGCSSRRGRQGGHLQSQAVLPDILTPSCVCILSPWKLGERRIALHPFTLAAGTAKVAPFETAPPPAARSHTVVESSRLFSGYGGALRGSSFLACSDSLWWGYGGGLRPRRPCAVDGFAVVTETEPVRLDESPFTGPAGEDGSSL